MDEEQGRAAVIEAARTFIGAKYHHEGRVKAAGVDCGTLIAAVFEHAGVRPPIDIQQYSAQWHLHSSEPLYERAIAENGGRLVDEPKPADIALYFQGKQFAHGAIVTAVSLASDLPSGIRGSTIRLRILHAYAPARCVLEGGENEFPALAGARRKFFSAW